MHRFYENNGEHDVKGKSCFAGAAYRLVSYLKAVYCGLISETNCKL